MLNRKKEGGFTLIELMIVIAIIGVLAVVLVPKLSGSKDSAKAAGVLANAKSAEAFVAANMSKWNTTSLTTPSAIVAEINGQFPTGAPANPVKSSNAGITAYTVTAPTVAAGVVYVNVDAAKTPITIEAYGSDSEKVFTSTINY